MALGRWWAVGACMGISACGAGERNAPAHDDAGAAGSEVVAGASTGGSDVGGKAGSGTSDEAGTSSSSAGTSSSGGASSSSAGTSTTSGGALSTGGEHGGVIKVDVQGGAAGEGGGGGDTSAGGDTSVGGAAECELGEVSSAGTDQNLDLFGTIVYFEGGAALPAGRYRITYVDGCMKYASAQDWSIHAYAGAEPDGWWFVGADQTQKVVVPPGTVGFFVGSGGFATFDECVQANLALPPQDFYFAGGQLGVWLQDSPYSDNVAGVEGRNPKWKLTLLRDCEP